MLLATTQVEDVGRFIEVFSTTAAEKRKKHGSKGAFVFRELGRGGRFGAVVLIHVPARRAAGNLDLELDQELHGRYAVTSAALAMTASRITPATTSGCDLMRKLEAPSTSVTVEPARS